MGKRKSPEYKEYVAKLLVDDGRKATDIARELELTASTVRQWANEYREKQRQLANPDSEQLMSTSDLQKRLLDAERRLQEREEEIDILKKAMHVFTKNQT
jgi:transposase